MGKQERGRIAAFNSPLSNIIPFLQGQGLRSIFCNFFRLTFSEWTMSTWVCSISLLTISVALLRIWAEQATIILIPTKIQVIMSNVNPILLNQFLELCQPQIQYCSSWSSLCHGCSLVIIQLGFFFFSSPLVAVIVSVKRLRNVHQTLSLLLGFLLGVWGRGLQCSARFHNFKK